GGGVVAGGRGGLGGGRGGGRHAPHQPAGDDPRRYPRDSSRFHAHPPSAHRGVDCQNLSTASVSSSGHSSGRKWPHPVSARPAPGPGRPLIEPPCTRSPRVATVARSASPTPSDPPSAKTGMVNRLAARAFACARPSALKFARYHAKPARMAPGAEYWRVYSSRAAESIAYDRVLFVAKIQARNSRSRPWTSISGRSFSRLNANCQLL